MSFSGLYVLSTGLSGVQDAQSALSNNMVNQPVNGFKRSRVTFGDLLYHNKRVVGGVGNEVNIDQRGTGVQVLNNVLDFSPGNVENTGDHMNVALEGKGSDLIVLTSPEGEQAFTRDGAFTLDKEGRLVHAASGYLVGSDGIQFEPGSSHSLQIDKKGVVTVTNSNQETQELGVIELARFINPSGLESVGSNLYKATVASGEAELGIPGADEFQTILHRFLETSNVDLMKTMLEFVQLNRTNDYMLEAFKSSSHTLQSFTEHI